MDDYKVELKNLIENVNSKKEDRKKYFRIQKLADFDDYNCGVADFDLCTLHKKILKELEILTFMDLLCWTVSELESALKYFHIIRDVDAFLDEICRFVVRKGFDHLIFHLAEDEEDFPNCSPYHLHDYDMEIYELIDFIMDNTNRDNASVNSVILHAITTLFYH